MVSKVKYVGVCNNCGRKSEFYIRCGSHTLQLCCTCSIGLSSELMQHAAESREKMEAEYNNSVETGLIVGHQRPCSPQMIAEADCDNDPNCKRCFR